MAIEANDGGDFFPIWGTCLGMEMLGLITAGGGRPGVTPHPGSDYLTRCNSQQSLPLHLAQGWQDSRLYGSAPQVSLRRVLGAYEIFAFLLFMIFGLLYDLLVGDFFYELLTV